MRDLLFLAARKKNGPFVSASCCYSRVALDECPQKASSLLAGQLNFEGVSDGQI
jgi:hypothetical protein